jgi:hypothetical protein
MAHWGAPGGRPAVNRRRIRACAPSRGPCVGAAQAEPHEQALAWSRHELFAPLRILLPPIVARDERRIDRNALPRAFQARIDAHAHWVCLWPNRSPAVPGTARRSPSPAHPRAARIGCVRVTVRSQAHCWHSSRHRPYPCLGATKARWRGWSTCRHQGRCGGASTTAGRLPTGFSVPRRCDRARSPCSPVQVARCRNRATAARRRSPPAPAQEPQRDRLRRPPSGSASRWSAAAPVRERPATRTLGSDARPGQTRPVSGPDG